ncbi:peroxide stress protein YaaA [Paractinoplanes lichenicola]|uniref:Peroxide stress protein YaaA n=1 Tax=Paractinoplanes lichenicola TaxID=2802976 RepID=A0ABS1W506_9ACTN|nr:peroxide stress protein YaaA [Actinoplanes lichenicola]MBL7261773.1 peroxide stress protein YaaA [Actinoplanes lichenicola]
MLILLPPSEGKTPAASGDPVDPASLWLPALTTARKRVLSRLVAMSKRTSARATAESLAVLGLSPGQADEVTRNASLYSAAAAPAASVYTGVLYEALDAHSLAPAARAWLDARAVVFSGLWGVVRLDDRIPAYRLSVGVTLPVLGGMTSYWKKALPKALDREAAGRPVLDLRSGAYGAMWTPPAASSATVRVLHERVVGGVAKRSVVSHFNKATKGRLVRSLAETAAAPTSVDEIVTALRDLKYTVEEQPAPAGRPRQLDIVVADL